ncbi:unnamed protein product [Schistosoma margrebowiei]|uniref:Peptidyl-prolyl cis-trans isomerase n=1 Tax=Schistosoma margrebowiei TaxID=48269 RepID=A0A183MQY1_9TREM|nr:unnamed protein product [Schistosoma margrebowiei]
MVIEIYGLVHKESFQRASLLASKLGGAYWIYNHDVWRYKSYTTYFALDILYNRGNDGRSIYGPVFEDENYIIKHDRRGILSMANSGRHTNGSQFLITLAPAEWMDNRYVAFGRVIEGSLTLDKMEEVQTHYERPVKDICIENISVVNPNDLETKIV